MELFLAIWVESYANAVAGVERAPVRSLTRLSCGLWMACVCVCEAVCACVCARVSAHVPVCVCLSVCGCMCDSLRNTTACDMCQLPALVLVAVVRSCAPDTQAYIRTCLCGAHCFPPNLTL